MGRPDFKNNKSSVLGDSLVGLMDGLGKLLFYGGLLACVFGFGVLFWQVFGGSGASSEQVAQALQYQDICRQAALWGFLAASLGAAWLFWGEEVAGPILLISGLIFALTTWYLPMANGGQAGTELQGNAITAIATAGYPGVFVGLILIVVDIFGRIKMRIQEGAKAEQMKYGKGVKEERDVRDVFMGKCWQLPYCRKFIRERCPIYHAKRTCWKERVGCMCEESVIKNAMEGGTIPKDLAAATKFIPQNNKLSAAAKAERCRQCVIYNEHQKHKYKLFLPVTMVAIAAGYIALRPALAEGIQSALTSVDRIYTGVTLQANNVADPAAKATSVEGGAIAYNEVILFVLTLVALAYAIKFLEFLIWKLKI
jgi:hypothetical protein